MSSTTEKSKKAIIMDSSGSFKSSMIDGYDKEGNKRSSIDAFDVFKSIKIIDEFEEEEYRKKTRKRLIIILVSSIILALLVAATIVGVLVPMYTKKDSSSSISENEKSSIEAMCNTTLYKDSCYSSIYSMKMSSKGKSGPDSDSPEEIFMLSLQVALDELIRLRSSMTQQIVSLKQNDDLTRNAINVCENVIQDAVDHVNMSISRLNFDQDNTFSTDMVSDIRTWLSTAITDQETCLDGLMEFENISKTLQNIMRENMRNAIEYTSNSLAIISHMVVIIEGIKIPVHRKLLEQRHTGFLEFMNRRLIEENGVILIPNLTVAKDGRGDYRTITDAVNAMPKRSKDRFYIYVKEGEYVEQVVVDSKSWNLMIYGDGMNKTIVSGSLNYADGVAPFNSGTLIAEGRGFIAKDMGFKNTAGPDKFQAVALRSSSDQSIFYKCHIDGYQDTLYTHSNRQFYRSCLITGTIDFIFGNAAVVFQNCTIQPRQPGPRQYNVITAQGKSDPNQNTGISIQRSVISPFDHLKSVQTFLGRPWHNYSTTVVMETVIQGIIDPAGWISWDSYSEDEISLFYAEYKNNGPGSHLDNRVDWTGYRSNITQTEAGKFSVEEFIQGSKWLSKANVQYDPYI